MEGCGWDLDIDCSWSASLVGACTLVSAAPRHEAPRTIEGVNWTERDSLDCVHEWNEWAILGGRLLRGLICSPRFAVISVDGRILTVWIRWKFRSIYMPCHWKHLDWSIFPLLSGHHLIRNFLDLKSFEGCSPQAFREKYCPQELILVDLCSCWGEIALTSKGCWASGCWGFESHVNLAANWMALESEAIERKRCLLYQTRACLKLVF